MKHIDKILLTFRVTISIIWVIIWVIIWIVIAILWILWEAITGKEPLS